MDNIKGAHDATTYAISYLIYLTN